MKKYRVIVDGQEYEVGIEPLDQSELKAPAPAAAPAPAPAPAAGDEQVLSPMPGNILSVNVKAGSAVDGSGSDEDGKRDHRPPGRHGGQRQRGQRCRG